MWGGIVSSNLTTPTNWEGRTVKTGSTPKTGCVLLRLSAPHSGKCKNGREHTVRLRATGKDQHLCVVLCVVQLNVIDQPRRERAQDMRQHSL